MITPIIIDKKDILPQKSKEYLYDHSISTLGGIERNKPVKFWLSQALKILKIRAKPAKRILSNIGEAYEEENKK